MEKEDTGTSDPKEDLWLAQPACMFITILKHLNHLIHLPSGVRDIIMLDVKFVLGLVGAVDLERTVAAVVGVACNHIELDLDLVHNKFI
jgi:hypothetical protein